MDASLRRFSVFYFFYYAAIGAYTPYVGRWVDALGHGGFVVGGMLVLWYASRVLGPPAWAALTTRSAQPGASKAGKPIDAACTASQPATR